jgi:hypothetical protein
MVVRIQGATTAGGTDQNSGFIFTIDDESKGLDMKGDSAFGLGLGHFAKQQ